MGEEPCVSMWPRPAKEKRIMTATDRSPGSKKMENNGAAGGRASPSYHLSAAVRSRTGCQMSACDGTIRKRQIP